MIKYDNKNAGVYGKNMRFVRAEVYALRPIKLRRPFCDATCGPFEELFFARWLRLYEADGTYGECPCSEITAKTLLPMLLTGETMDYEDWYKRLYWNIRNCGFMGEAGMEVGRIDWALHDIMSKRANLPLHRFLGAERDFARAYWSGCGTNLTEEQLKEELQWGMERGYTCFKMKVGTNFGTELDNDIRRIALARETIGSQAELAVDVNQLLPWQEAADFAQRIEPYNIGWLEEPVHSHDLLGLRELCAASPVDIAMGESMRNAYIHAVYADFGVHHLQPATTSMSGIRDMLAVRDIASEKGIRMTSGGISPAYAAMVLSTASEDTLVEFLYPITMQVKDLMKKYPEEKDGVFLLSAEPGASISLDEQKAKADGMLEGIEFYS